MKLNQATDYAFRAVLYLSQCSGEEVVEARVIADHEHIPMRFMLRILLKLVRAGIVKSFRGVRGGYALAKTPRQITMRDVIEAIEGPICISSCLHAPDGCSKGNPAQCSVHEVLLSIQRVMNEKLEECNFETLRNL
ncbi:MAG: Rrf2 family transcriptional regulator [Firmicutes bacterium]|nr:Rrf2 family transcriptional regulator [Bacillota bacterium]